MEAPAEPFELLLAKAVSVARRRCRVVARPVALDREHEPATLCRMLGDEVDPVAGGAELRDERDADASERVADVDLERVECRLLERALA
jgi:hypothetical protein